MLLSSSFLNGGMIPKRFTCDGENVSPPLRWRGTPPNVGSFALVFQDMSGETGGARHWAVFDIPPYHKELTEGAGFPEGFEDFRHAVNDFRRLGYVGPCPKALQPAHPYRFKLFALSCKELPIRTHPSCEEVEREAERHKLAEATLEGFYERARRESA